MDKHFAKKVDFFYRTLAANDPTQRRDQSILKKLWEPQILERIVLHCNNNKKTPANIPKSDSISKFISSFKGDKNTFDETIENMAWSDLINDIKTEAQNRIDLIRAFDKAEKENRLFNLNTIPDDVLNFALWCIAKDAKDNVFEIDVSVYDKDKICLTSKIGNLCNLDCELSQLSKELSNSDSYLEIMQKHNLNLHKQVYHNMTDLTEECKDCKHSRCIKGVLAQCKYYQDRDILIETVMEREKYEEQHGRANYFEFQWNDANGLRYVTDDNLKIAQHLLEIDAIKVSKRPNASNLITISSKVSCKQIGEMVLGKPYPLKTEVESNQFLNITRYVENTDLEKIACSECLCCANGCPIGIAGYLYYLKKNNKLDAVLQSDRTWYQMNKAEVEDRINQMYQDKRKTIIDKNTKEKEEIKKEIQQIGCEIHNIDTVIDAVYSSSNDGLHCIIEAEKGLNIDKLIDALARSLRKTGKIFIDKKNENDKDLIKCPLNVLAADMFYMSSSKPTYRYFSQNKLYVLTHIEKFIKEYNRFSSRPTEIRCLQLEHMLNILSQLIEKNYIILIGTKKDIDTLFKLIPDSKCIYKETYIKIDDMTNEQLFQHYKTKLEKELIVELIKNEEKYERDFVEYVLNNRGRIPFKNLDLANYLAMYSNTKDKIIFPEDMYNKKTLEESLKNIIGLENIKQKVKEFEKYTRFTNKAKILGLKMPNQNLHMIFTGNPGTGKTTIARIIAQMLFDIGVLEENKLIEVDRKDLVGQYIGHTAVKTSEIIDKAMGGVLFIDEAYALTQNKGNDFGAEAIATLIKAMEDKKGKFVVIFAGYEDEMKTFVETNPGMASRIGYTFQFDDYSEDELVDIYMMKMKNIGFYLDDGVEKEVRSVCAYFRKRKAFGNGRFIDKLVQETIMRHAKMCKRDALSRIRVSEIPQIEDLNVNIQERQSSDELLDGIIGLNDLKVKIREFEQYMIYTKNAQKNGISLPSRNMHMIFTGNPGTGKTTVARIMAKMLFDIGVLKENKLIEVERKDLIGQHIGQTAPKTNEVIEKALGGVLFIDEAYAITQNKGNDFGAEAIATLIKAMEDKKDEIVIIFAGYKKEMQEFVNVNPGMASRIGYTFDFPDYTEDELSDIFTYKMQKYGFTIEEEAKQEVTKLMSYFTNVNNIGNGRFVDRVIQATLMKQAKENSKLYIINKDCIPTTNEMVTNMFNDGNLMMPENISTERLREIACHEIGHAFVAYKLTYKPNIKKITTKPKNANEFKKIEYKQENSYAKNKHELFNEIVIALAGMASESLLLGEYKNKSTNDLVEATKIANEMITMYGMSEIGCSFMDEKIRNTMSRDIYKEENKMIGEAFEKATQILNENKETVLYLINHLLQNGEITEDDFLA